MKTFKHALSLLGCIAVTGCTHLGNSVFIASDTSLGINGSTNTATTSGKLIIGYDRKFVAYVPRKNRDDDRSDAMAAFNCTHLEVRGITLTKFYEQVATGAAADQLAKNALTVNGKDCVITTRTTPAGSGSGN